MDSNFHSLNISIAILVTKPHFVESLTILKRTTTKKNKILDKKKKRLRRRRRKNKRESHRTIICHFHESVSNNVVGPGRTRRCYFGRLSFVFMSFFKFLFFTLSLCISCFKSTRDTNARAAKQKEVRRVLISTPLLVALAMVRTRGHRQNSSCTVFKNIQYRDLRTIKLCRNEKGTK